MVAYDREVATKMDNTLAGRDSIVFNEGKPVDFSPLSTFTPPPDVILTWCNPFLGSWLCTDYYSDGTKDVYRYHDDRTGVWP